MYAQSLHFNKIFQCLKRENSVEEHAPRDLSSRIYAMTVLYMYSEYNIPGGTAELTRGVHRTLTPRSQTLFHHLGTIPVEWEWLALIDWTRILAPCILGHDSLVPSLIGVELRSLGTRLRPQIAGNSRE